MIQVSQFTPRSNVLRCDQLLDYERQICSGMWGGSQAYINGTHHFLLVCVVSNLQAVSFDNASPGHLAMVIYEWTDVMYLGKITTSETDDDLPVSLSIF